MNLNDLKSFLADENGLKRLCTEKIRESVFLDFKKTGYGKKDSDKIEACKDVASFANAGGPGYILIGIEDKDSIAIDVPGIPDSENELKRIRNVISKRIEPRIDKITVRPIDLSNGNYVIVGEIPVCEFNIYAVRIQDGRYDFFIRRDTDKVELSFTEIQYRLLADLESLRSRRKAEGISVYDNVTVSPISVSSRYHKNLFEFKVASKDSSSITLEEKSTNYIITIPYDLIQTVYYDYKLGLKIIYLLLGYHLIVDIQSKELQKQWKIMPK